MKRKAKKKFDALAFKAKAQAEILKETQGMTRKQEVEYLERCVETGPMAECVKQVKKASRGS